MGVWVLYSMCCVCYSVLIGVNDGAYKVLICVLFILMMVLIQSHDSLMMVLHKLVIQSHEWVLDGGGIVIATSICIGSTTGCLTVFCILFSCRYQLDFKSIHQSLASPSVYIIISICFEINIITTALVNSIKINSRINQPLIHQVILYHFHCKPKLYQYHLYIKLSCKSILIQSIISMQITCTHI